MTRDPRRSDRRGRDAVVAQVFAEESHCWLCGNPVDFGLPFMSLGEATVDEVVPVSKGGSATDRANCRLAHRSCNSSRGNRSPGVVQSRVPFTVPTSREW